MVGAGIRSGPVSHPQKLRSEPRGLCREPVCDVTRRAIAARLDDPRPPRPRDDRPALGPRGGDPRGGREGDPRRGPSSSRSSSAPTAPGPTPTTRPRPGTTSLVTLALLTAGEKPNSPPIARALDYLRNFGPEQLKSTYAVGAPDDGLRRGRPERDQLRIAANVAWLERAQIKPGDRVNWPGSWTYSAFKTRHGDNSNTQYALLGLNAASEVGVPVKPEVWALARSYWERCQHNDGGWGYHAATRMPATASMTCAGISSLVITGLKRFQGQEFLDGERDPQLRQGGDQHQPPARHRLAGHAFPGRPELRQRPAVEVSITSTAWSAPAGSPACGSSASTTGIARGPRSWSTTRTGSTGFWRAGADRAGPARRHELRAAVPGQGARAGADQQAPPRAAAATGTTTPTTSATSSAWSRATGSTCSPGRSSTPTPPRSRTCSRRRSSSSTATRPPSSATQAKKNLRDYVEQGGFIFAEACCGRRGVRPGLPSPDGGDLPRAPSTSSTPWPRTTPSGGPKHLLTPDVHPLWGIEHGCRTVVIYSPDGPLVLLEPGRSTARPTRP